MNNLCNCYDCQRSFAYALQNLRIEQFKHDLKNNCANCEHSNTCPTILLNNYLAEKFPNFDFTIKDLSELPEEYWAGICNYIEEKRGFKD